MVRHVLRPEPQPLRQAELPLPNLSGPEGGRFAGWRRTTRTSKGAPPFRTARASRGESKLPRALKAHFGEFRFFDSFFFVKGGMPPFHTFPPISQAANTVRCHQLYSPDAAHKAEEHAAGITSGPGAPKRPSPPTDGAAPSLRRCAMQGTSDVRFASLRSAMPAWRPALLALVATKLQGRDIPLRPDLRVRTCSSRRDPDGGRSHAEETAGACQCSIASGQLVAAPSRSGFGSRASARGVTCPRRPTP